MEPPVPVTFKAAAAIAGWLYRVRHVLLTVGVGAGAWLVVAIVDTDRASTAALVPLTVMLWVGLALAIAHSLPRLPRGVAAGDGPVQRFRKRLRLAAYGFALVAMLALTVFALAVAWRALPLAMSSYS